MSLIKRLLLGWRLTLPVGGRRIAIPIVLTSLLICCCGPFGVAMLDVSIRQAGLAPTYTPRPTSTTGPTQTSRPTATERPTRTPRPTRALDPTATGPVDLPARAVEIVITPDPPTVGPPTSEPPAPTITPASEVVEPTPANPPTTAPILSTPVPSPTDTPITIPTATRVSPPTDTPAPAGPTATQNGRLRAGPGTNYPQIGSVSPGQALNITGRNPAGDWYQLASGAWISATLVRSAPGALPIAANIPPPPAPTAAPVVRSAPPVPPAAESGASNPNAFTCIGGCTQPPPGSQCVIKGNVNSSKERIYHVPGMRDYNRTNVRPEEGDRWFCTEAEARAAGFRRAMR